eukprot:354208-Chlamydomonas_euryale.AAC.17
MDRQGATELGKGGGQRAGMEGRRWQRPYAYLLVHDERALGDLCVAPLENVGKLRGLTVELVAPAHQLAVKRLWLRDARG